MDTERVSKFSPTSWIVCAQFNAVSSPLSSIKDNDNSYSCSTAIQIKSCPSKKQYAINSFSDDDIQSSVSKESNSLNKFSRQRFLLNNYQKIYETSRSDTAQYEASHQNSKCCNERKIVTNKKLGNKEDVNIINEYESKTNSKNEVILSSNSLSDKSLQMNKNQYVKSYIHGSNNKPVAVDEDTTSTLLKSNPAHNSLIVEEKYVHSKRDKINIKEANTYKNDMIFSYNKIELDNNSTSAPKLSNKYKTLIYLNSESGRSSNTETISIDLYNLVETSCSSSNTSDRTISNAQNNSRELRDTKSINKIFTRKSVSNRESTTSSSNSKNSECSNIGNQNDMKCSQINHMPKIDFSEKSSSSFDSFMSLPNFDSSSNSERKSAVNKHMNKQYSQAEAMINQQNMTDTSANRFFTITQNNSQLTVPRGRQTIITPSGGNYRISQNDQTGASTVLTNKARCTISAGSNKLGSDSRRTVINKKSMNPNKNPTMLISPSEQNKLTANSKYNKSVVKFDDTVGNSGSEKNDASTSKLTRPTTHFAPTPTIFEVSDDEWAQNYFDNDGEAHHWDDEEGDDQQKTGIKLSIKPNSYRSSSGKQKMSQNIDLIITPPRSNSSSIYRAGQSIRQSMNPDSNGIDSFEDDEDMVDDEQQQIRVSIRAPRNSQTESKSTKCQDCIDNGELQCKTHGIPPQKDEILIKKDKIIPQKHEIPSKKSDQPVTSVSEVQTPTKNDKETCHHCHCHHHRRCFSVTPTFVVQDDKTMCHNPTTKPLPNVDLNPSMENTKPSPSNVVRDLYESYLKDAQLQCLNSRIASCRTSPCYVRCKSRSPKHCVQHHMIKTYNEQVSKLTTDNNVNESGTLLDNQFKDDNGKVSCCRFNSCSPRTITVSPTHCISKAGNEQPTENTTNNNINESGSPQEISQLKDDNCKVACCRLSPCLTPCITVSPKLIVRDNKTLACIEQPAKPASHININPCMNILDNTQVELIEPKQDFLNVHIAPNMSINAIQHGHCHDDIVCRDAHNCHHSTHGNTIQVNPNIVIQNEKNKEKNKPKQSKCKGPRHHHCHHHRKHCKKKRNPYPKENSQEQKKTKKEENVPSIDEQTSCSESSEELDPRLLCLLLRLSQNQAHKQCYPMRNFIPPNYYTNYGYPNTYCPNYNTLCYTNPYL